MNSPDVAYGAGRADGTNGLLIVDMLREILGPIGILGNYLVIRSDDGHHVAMSHAAMKVPQGPHR